MTRISKESLYKFTAKDSNFFLADELANTGLLDDSRLIQFEEVFFTIEKHRRMYFYTHQIYEYWEVYSVTNKDKMFVLEKTLLKCCEEML